MTKPWSSVFQHLSCSCQRDTSGRGNACPVPQQRFAVVDLDARVRQQLLLHRCVQCVRASLRLPARLPHPPRFTERKSRKGKLIVRASNTTFEQKRLEPKWLRQNLR